MRSSDAVLYFPTPRAICASRDLAPKERAARVTARPLLGVGPRNPGTGRTHRSEVYGLSVTLYSEITLE